MTWTKIGHKFGDSGTLLVWSKIDRCIWRTEKAIIDNSEFLIRRMYRKFINSGEGKIIQKINKIAQPKIVRLSQSQNIRSPLAG
ncbi:hypothetical protein JYQ62_31460 [Nostoc sp. UHCC 0702]|nr:hypothetical protein JYQ62_31460 [Nostoc sp. UHCC 0702]